MTNASRAQVDLDALARDLRQDKGQTPQASGKADPLAELGMIGGVGILVLTLPFT